jgi:hypothetical protein
MRTRVRVQKLEDLSLIRGSRKSRHHFPATETEVSWPSLVYGDVSLRFATIISGASYHVRSDEHPLRQFALGQIFVEHGSILVGHGNVLLVGQALGSGVCVEDDRRVVLPHVVVGLGLLVDIALALEARVRHVLLVSRPRDALVLEQVHERGDIGIDSLEVVVVTAKGITADGSDVVGHRRVCHAEHIGDADSLGSQPL